LGCRKGVLNVVNGDGETGAAIVAHPDIDKIAFTGSTEVGRIIRKATAKTTKKLSLELGGKSPFIVFDDADMDSAVEGLVDGIWFNQGQVCCAGSRLLVQERVAERLYEKIRARMETLRVGSPLDKAVDIGAIVDQVQYDRIASLVKTGIAEGATCWQPDISLPERAVLQADAADGRVAGCDRCAGGDLWAGAGGDDVSHSGGGCRAGEQYDLWAGRVRVEREHQRGAGRGRAGEGRRGVGECDEPLRRSVRVWRVSRERLRARGRQGGDV
jgi:hypothetical protein